MAEDFYKLKIKAKDSLHISCAVISKCDYFITTDDFILKKVNEITNVNIVSPIIFIELEEFDDN